MRMYLCIFILALFNVVNAQTNSCSGYESDNMYLRYTAVGAQKLINGDHSKAINESRKIANIMAETELAKMVNAVVTRASEQMTYESDSYLDKYIDTTLVSSYKVFKGMKTVCQSETKLVDKIYFTYVTKEISLDNISEMLFFNDEITKKKFRKLIEK